MKTKSYRYRIAFPGMADIYLPRLRQAGCLRYLRTDIQWEDGLGYWNVTSYYALICASQFSSYYRGFLPSAIVKSAFAVKHLNGEVGLVPDPLAMRVFQQRAGKYVRVDDLTSTLTAMPSVPVNLAFMLLTVQSTTDIYNINDVEMQAGIDSSVRGSYRDIRKGLIASTKNSKMLM